MGSHLSVISIYGNHLKDMRPMFEDFGYEVNGPPRMARKDDVIAMQLIGTRCGQSVVKAVYVDHGWTYLLDGELALMFLHDKLKKWSAELRTTIVGWIAEDDSCTYGFNVFYNGEMTREVIRSGLECTEEGVRLPPEWTIQWSCSSEDDVLATVSRIGAPYDWLSEDCRYFVYTLNERSYPIKGC